MQSMHASSGEAARHSPSLQPSLRALRRSPAALGVGFARPAQGALGCDSAQARGASQSGRARTGQGRTGLMMCVIGPRFSQLMPTTDRASRVDEMLATLVACDAGHMTPAGIEAAVGVPRLSNASGFAVAKRMGLIAPLASSVLLYQVSPLGETVLRFLDAEA